MRPIFEELCPAPGIEDALRAVQRFPNVALFESTLLRGRLSRFSFLTADPIRTGTTTVAVYGCDPFSECRALLLQLEQHRVPELPPFQGGIAGILSYELGGCWERVRRSKHDEFQIPDMTWGLYDWVIAWDHDTDQAWILSHGIDSMTLERSPLRADKRVAQVKQALANYSPASEQQFDNPPPLSDDSSSRQLNRTQPIAQQYELAGYLGISSDFSKPDYLKAVAQVIDFIEAGDIFQANLSQRLLRRWEASPLSLYCLLRNCNPAPFAGFFQFDDWAVASASPERFVKVQDREVETRPIKGTRQRRSIPEADLFTRDELRASEKDVAENVMIVDLLRNDLSRVCEPGSISVPQLCVVETYATVQHLVSEVRGRLADTRLLDTRTSTLANYSERAGSPQRAVPASQTNHADVWTLLAATFPGGSITGAPKVRAMEIIAELEPTTRGPYCGSMFYVGFDGTMDSNILIRTFVYRHGWVQCSVGGGIVAQSSPQAEFEETLHKAEGMLRVFA